MEIRKYICPNCRNFFFVDCDASDYPDWCPYCDAEISGREDKYESYEIEYDESSEAEYAKEPNQTSIS